MTITLPIPDGKLSPNGRGHWRKKSRHLRAARVRAHKRTLEAIGEHFHKQGRPVPTFIGYTIGHFFKTAAFRDDDNADAACKAYRDGIADALGIDDKKLPKLALSTFAKDAANPRVEITLHTAQP